MKNTIKMTIYGFVKNAIDKNIPLTFLSEYFFIKSNKKSRIKLVCEKYTVSNEGVKMNNKIVTKNNPFNFKDLKYWSKII
ncbi:hypothetical protein MASR2M47_21030 [Draconibacterium sp.]